MSGPEPEVPSDIVMETERHDRTREKEGVARAHRSYWTVNTPGRVY